MKMSLGSRALSLIVVVLLLMTALSVVALVAVDAATDGDYTYSVSGGQATVTGYTGAGGAITIPSTLGGNPTVAIGYGAFYKSTSITSVTIPSGVTSIGRSAFNLATHITSVVIPDTVTNIALYGFFDCRALTSVTIPSSVTSIGDYAFAGCTALSAINVDGANQNYASVNGVLFNKANTTLIEYPAGKAGSVDIPTSLSAISSYAFSDAIYLTAINVDPGNPTYTSIDGVLFNKANTTLLQYPGAKEGTYAVPESVTIINNFGFYHCMALTSVTIPANVTNIGEYAFTNSTSLTTVAIQGNVTYIGLQAFKNCSSLTTITFYGTVAPTSVGTSWIDGTPTGLVGHAYASSNFPSAGSTFHGLTMGTALSATPAAPGAPTNLVAKNSAGSVQLTWAAPADPGSGISDYLVFRGTTASGEGTTAIATVIGTSYKDTTASVGTPYYYTVKANNGYGASAASNEAHATAASATVPSAPLSFTVTSGTNQINLAWSAPSDDGGSTILLYTIYRSIGGGSYSEIGTTSSGSFSYVDTNETAGNSYSYYVVASNSVGKGTTSAVQSVGPASGGSSDSTVIFVVIGIVAVVIVVALLFLFMKRRK
jgi:hypothetical protein